MKLITQRGTDFSNQTLLNCDSALYFNKADSQYVECPNTASGRLNFSAADSFTVSLLLNIQGRGTLRISNGFYNNPVLLKSEDISATIRRGYEIRAVHTPGSTDTDPYLLIAEVGQNISGGSDRIRVNKSGLIPLRWYYVTMVYDAGDLFLYINGNLVDSDTGYSTSKTITNGENLRFGRVDVINSDSQILYANSVINNALILDKALTDYEIYHHLYTHGGEPREPLHENVVAHYPLSQRFSYEVQAGDEALNRGLSIGDYAVWDVSERYNYAKSTQITAQHGKLVNYSANEVGLDADQTNQSFKNFYCVPDLPRFTPIGKRYIKADQSFDIVSNFSHFDRDQAVTYVFKLKVNDLPSNNVGFSSQESNIVPLNKGIQLQFLPSLFQLNYLSSLTNRIVINYIFDATKENIVILTYSGNSQANGFNCYVNGKIVTPSIINDTLTQSILPTQPDFTINKRLVDDEIGDGFISSFEILNSDKSSDQSFINHVSKCGTAYGYVPDSEFLLAVDFNKDKDQQLSTLPNTPSYTIQAYKNGSTFTPTVGDGTYLEAKTQLPPIAECLKFGSEGGYVDFDTSNPPDTNSSPFTFVCLLKDSNRVIPIGVANSGRVYGALRSSGYTISNGAFWAIDQYTSTTNPTTLANRGKYVRRSPSTIVNSIGYTKSFTLGGSYSDFDDLNLHVVVYDDKTQTIRTYLNNKATTPTNLSNHNLNSFGYFRFGTGNYVNTTGEGGGRAYEDWYMIAFGYWKRALEGWEIASLYNNQLSYGSNPFAWNTSQNTGFQDQLEIWHQFQTGSIYWDGTNYRVTNYGSGADATLGNYTTGSADFVTDNPNSIVDINTLR